MLTGRSAPRAALAAALVLLVVTAGSADNWPRFRGPNGTGVAADKDVPVLFGEKDNLLWKAPLPGKGNSSPVIWGDGLFVQSASENGLSSAKRSSSGVSRLT